MLADITPKERLQPSLLDRLTDDEPDNRAIRNPPVMSLHRLRESVLRDLEFLLNTTQLGATTDLDGLAGVERSTLNYGVPDLVGKTRFDITQIERLLRRAILDFEPRLLKDSVRVQHLGGDTPGSKAGARPTVLSFSIEAELWAHPVPERLFLRTELDLDRGEIKIGPASDKA